MVITVSRNKLLRNALSKKIECIRRDSLFTKRLKIVPFSDDFEENIKDG